MNIIPVEKNKIYRINIDAYTHNGEGIARINGFAIFVPFSAVGDVLDVLIVKTEKNYAYAKIINIIQPSSARVIPPCPVFGRCGGCQLLHLNYDEQLKLKRQSVIDAMQRIGGLKNIEIMPVIGAECQFNYRNKAQYPIGISNEGEPVSGFYSSRSHNIIPSDSCEIQHPSADIVVKCVVNWMKEFKILPYNESTKKGLIRHVYTRMGFESNELMVVIVSTTSKLPFINKLVDNLLELKLNIKSIMLNINKNATNIVLGKENIILWGTDKITDSIEEIEFNISHQSFYQVNPQQTKVLYQKAMELAQIKPSDIIFDIYCGIGTISLFAEKYCKQVHGIEIIPDAIEDAKQNAKLNNIDNAIFHCGDAAIITEKLKNSGISPDVAIIDPPRKGCDQQLLNTLISLAPQKIIYISCNPATLARDLSTLVNHYNIAQIHPVDMFPNTRHVECCCLLYRKDNI